MFYNRLWSYIRKGIDKTNLVRVLGFEYYIIFFTRSYVVYGESISSSLCMCFPFICKSVQVFLLDTRSPLLENQSSSNLSVYLSVCLSICLFICTCEQSSNQTEALCLVLFSLYRVTYRIGSDPIRIAFTLTLR